MELIEFFLPTTGIGKSHTLRLIRDTLFKKREDTGYFEYIAVPHQYPHQKDDSQLSAYRQDLHKRIIDAVSRFVKSICIPVINS